MILFSEPETLEGSGRIKIPATQAGHLGLIPGRNVQVFLIREHNSPPAHCEVAITPIHVTRDGGSFLRLVCVMHENADSLARLLKALALLNVNIVAQESSTVHHQKYHYVSMVIDLDHSEYLIRRANTNIATNSSIEAVYMKESAIVPLYQARYVELFETIMAYCGDVITYNEIGLPRLSIKTFDIREKPWHPHPVIVEGKTADIDIDYGVSVTLDQQLITAIRRYLDVPQGEKLSYFLASETEYRRLRVVFARRDQAHSMLHVGFFHNDTPGTMSAIINILTDKKFVVMSTLHTSINPETTVLETILWYRGEGFPSNATDKEKIQWLASIMTTDLKPHHLDDIIHREVFICSNIHRSYVDHYAGSSIPISQHLAVTSRRKARPALDENQKWNKRTSSMISELENGIFRLKSQHDEANLPAINMLERIKARRTKKPRIFISASVGLPLDHIVKMVEERIRAKYKGFFAVDHYRVQNSEYALDTAKQLIAACTGFIGIWHEDIRLPIDQTPELYGTSPWMHFEFGHALALEKEWFLARSSKLHKRAYEAITPGYVMLVYNENGFRTEVLPGIVKWCDKLMKTIVIRSNIYD